MSYIKTGDWHIVMFLDGIDANGINTYQHVYLHKDGRKAYVGPGYCSDPDLEWILFQKDRRMKEWSGRQDKRKKVSQFAISTAWIIILIKGALAIPLQGTWVLISILGYWLAQLGSYGFFNNFRALLIRGPTYRADKKIRNLFVVSCFIYIGHLLIGIGKFDNLSFLFLQIHVLWFACFMGIVEAALDKWKEHSQ